MKFISTFLLAVVLMIAEANAQGIEFFHGSFEEGLAEAQAQGKLIFIDAYAEWCGPCKKMAATVFKEDAVGNFYNQNFINMKIDMEKGEGPTLARKYKVTAYPTFFFIDEKGEVVATAMGGRATDQFLQLGENALNKYDKSGEYVALYESGDRSPDMLRKYAYALLASKKEHLKIANEYFNTQTDLTSEVNLQAIYDFASEADSRIFDLFIQHKAALIKLKTEEKILHRIEVACLTTVKKGAEYKFKNLLEEGKSKMKANYPQKYKEFSVRADMIYGLGTTDATLYAKASKNYLSKYANNNAVELHNVAKTILTKFSDNAASMKLAESWAKKGAENGGLSYQYFTYAMILYSNNKMEPALRVAKKSRELAINEHKSTQEIDELLKIIKP